MLVSTGDTAESYFCMFLALRVLFLYYFLDCTVFIFALTVVNLTDGFVIILIVGGILFVGHRENRHTSKAAALFRSSTLLCWFLARATMLRALYYSEVLKMYTAITKMQ